ncbi:hypothetical protein ACFL96_16645, partial [Thermoproteota archaeon]
MKMKKSNVIFKYFKRVAITGNESLEPHLAIKFLILDPEVKKRCEKAEGKYYTAIQANNSQFKEAFELGFWKRFSDFVFSSKKDVQDEQDGPDLPKVDGELSEDSRVDVHLEGEGIFVIRIRDYVLKVNTNEQKITEVKNKEDLLGLLLWLRMFNNFLKENLKQQDSDADFSSALIRTSARTTQPQYGSSQRSRRSRLRRALS